MTVASVACWRRCVDQRADSARRCRLSRCWPPSRRCWRLPAAVADRAGAIVRRRSRLLARRKPSSSTATASCSRRSAPIDSARRLAWVPLADISPALIATLIAAEDKRFHEHAGVDWPRLRERGVGQRRPLARRTRPARRIDLDHAARRRCSIRSSRSRPTRAPSRRSGTRRRRRVRSSARGRKAQILEAYLNLASYRGELAGHRCRGARAVRQGAGGSRRARRGDPRRAAARAERAGADGGAARVHRRGDGVRRVRHRTRVRGRAREHDGRARRRAGWRRRVPPRAARQRGTAPGARLLKTPGHARGHARSTPTCSATRCACCASISPSSPIAPWAMARWW